MKKLSGGCRCNAIRYECVSEPLAVSFRYCRDCQQASGGPFCNYAVVPAGAVTITKGQPKSYTVQADSGNTVQREFCAECGAPLFARNGTVFVLTVGSLDDARDITPTMAIWLDSAQPWAPIPEHVERFRKNPPITLGN
jgi:hypothetical protein